MPLWYTVQVEIPQHNKRIGDWTWQKEFFNSREKGTGTAATVRMSSLPIGERASTACGGGATMLPAIGCSLIRTLWASATQSTSLNMQLSEQAQGYCFLS